MDWSVGEIARNAKRTGRFRDRSSRIQWRVIPPLYYGVVVVVIDGAIDTAFIADNFPARYALKDQDGILDPAHIADNYWHLHAQPRDAWTFELDLRPWQEKW